MGGSLIPSEKALWVEKRKPKSPPPQKDRIVCGFGGCSFSAPKPGGMEAHVKKAHRKAKFGCTDCKKVFVNRAEKEIHYCQY